MSHKKSLRELTVSGVLWNFAELLLRRGTTGVTTLILAWFLTPEDFGLVAMLAVFIAFANIMVDAGFSQAMIRKKAISTRAYNTAFFSNITLAVVVYLLLFTVSPAIAKLYDIPELVELTRVASLAVVLNALYLVPQVALRRELKFKLQMSVSLPAAIISGLLAIVLAYLGMGVWSLIFQVITQSALTAFFYWRLRLWQPDLEFDWNELKCLFSFSSYLLVNQIFNVPFKHMYIFVIAKWFSASLAGFYYFAEKLRDLMIEQLVSSIRTVTFPALAQLQDNPEKLKNGYRKVMSMTTFVLFPVLIFVAAMAEAIFTALLPNKWLPAASFLQLMCIATLMYPLHFINVNAFKVKGRADLVLYLSLIKKIITFSILIMSFSYGITGILIGQIIASVLTYLPNCIYSKKLIGYSVKEQLADVIPSLTLAIVIGLVLFYLQTVLSWPSLIEVIVMGALGAGLYLSAAWVFKFEALTLVNRLVLNKVKGQHPA